MGAEMFKRDPSKKASFYLTLMRDHPEGYAYCLRYMCEAMDEEGECLQELGTSYDELWRLSREGAKIVAKQWLKGIQKNPERIKTDSLYLMCHVFLGRLSAKDIKATERELIRARRIALVATLKPFRRRHMSV